MLSFNSIKVQLEHVRRKTKTDSFGCFNSIKVQLELEKALKAGTLNWECFNSIKVQLELQTKVLYGNRETVSIP